MYLIYSVSDNDTEFDNLIKEAKKLSFKSETYVKKFFIRRINYQMDCV